MLDTGAGPSLIKLSKKPENFTANTNEILELKGITRDSICTLGKIEILVKDLKIPMHLVPDDFPIEEDGLIGSEIFRKFKAKIDYNKNSLKIGKHNFPLLKTPAALEESGQLMVVRSNAPPRADKMATPAALTRPTGHGPTSVDTQVNSPEPVKKCVPFSRGKAD